MVRWVEEGDVGGGGSRVGLRFLEFFLFCLDFCCGGESRGGDARRGRERAWGRDAGERGFFRFWVLQIFCVFWWVLGIVMFWKRLGKKEGEAGLDRV